MDDVEAAVIIASSECFEKHVYKKKNNCIPIDMDMVNKMINGAKEFEEKYDKEKR